jgi:hypothetical protein
MHAIGLGRLNGYGAPVARCTVETFMRGLARRYSRQARSRLIDWRPALYRHHSIKPLFTQKWQEQDRC